MLFFASLYLEMERECQQTNLPFRQLTFAEGSLSKLRRKVWVRSISPLSKMEIVETYPATCLRITFCLVDLFVTRTQPQ